MRVLNYQPFIISDDLHTGVAYSWVYSEEGGRSSNAGDFVFDRRGLPRQVWEDAFDANRRLAHMYDTFLDAIAARFPGCGLADVACNNGYFPIGAAIRGMKPCVGFDKVDYTAAMTLLRDVTGVEAAFHNCAYNSWTHVLDGFEPHDVVVASQIMQHISDPTYFLSFIASRAKKALFLYTGMGPTDELAIYYGQPNRFYKDATFPNCFDNDTGLSRGLLFKGLEMLGFDEIIELPWAESWLPLSWYSTGSQKALLCIRKSRPYFHNHYGV